MKINSLNPEFAKAIGLPSSVGHRAPWSGLRGNGQPQVVEGYAAFEKARHDFRARMVTETGGRLID